MTPCFDAWNRVYSPISIYPQNFRPPNLMVWPLWHFLVNFGGFLGPNGHFFMYNNHFRCLHQKQNVERHLYASFGHLQIIYLGARALKPQFWAVSMCQLFFLCMTPCVDAWNRVCSRISIYPQNFKPPNLMVWSLWHFIVIFGGVLEPNGHFWAADPKRTMSCRIQGRISLGPSIHTYVPHQKPQPVPRRPKPGQNQALGGQNKV